MVVRFLPPEGSASGAFVSERSDGGDLAEVIDLRSRFQRDRDRPARGGESEGALLDLGSRLPGASRLASPPNEPSTHGEADGRFGPGFSPEPELLGSAEPAPLAHTAGAESLTADEGPLRTVSEDGVRLLARRARSSGELRRELIEIGHDATEVEWVIVDFEQSLYLDDVGLARVLSENLRERKRLSRAQIRNKLRERLLPGDVIDAVLGELDDDEEQTILEQAAEDRARRLTGLDRQTAERRLLGFLARRGWSGERAVRVARAALDSASARGAVRFR